MNTTLNKENNSVPVKTSWKTVKYITRIGLLSAFSFVLMIFEFPIPFFPPFLKIDFGDAAALIGGIALGPLASVFIMLIKNLLNLVLHSTTGGIGEIANFVVGVAWTLPIALLYRKKPTLKSMLLGMLLGAVSMTIASAITNYFVTLPLWDPTMTSSIRINMIITVFSPFNLIKATLVSIFTLILFNGVKGVLKYVRIK